MMVPRAGTLSDTGNVAWPLRKPLAMTAGASTRAANAPPRFPVASAVVNAPKLKVAASKVATGAPIKSIPATNGNPTRVSRVTLRGKRRDAQDRGDARIGKCRKDVPRIVRDVSRDGGEQLQIPGCEGRRGDLPVAGPVSADLTQERERVGQPAGGRLWRLFAVLAKSASKAGPKMPVKPVPMVPPTCTLERPGAAKN